jgi:hypothetical protein
MNKYRSIFGATAEDKLTNGEIYEPAMRVQSADEARGYFSAIVRYLELNGQDRKTAVETARWNIHYWAGYYSAKTRERVLKLYGEAWKWWMK